MSNSDFSLYYKCRVLPPEDAWRIICEHSSSHVRGIVHKCIHQPFDIMSYQRLELIEESE